MITVLALGLPAALTGIAASALVARRAAARGAARIAPALADLDAALTRVEGAALARPPLARTATPLVLVASAPEV
jgi:hypothetical protein